MRRRASRPGLGAAARPYALSSEERAELARVAARLGTSAGALAAVIAFESGWNPRARNPRSGATGLIQFMPKTAARLGTSTVAIARMTRVEQLALVEAYLRPYAGRLGSLQAVAMAVFYPSAMAWPSTSMFPPKVQAANPGIRTVADYVARVQARAGAVLLADPLATPAARPRPWWVYALSAGAVAAVLIIGRRARARRAQSSSLPHHS